MKRREVFELAAILVNDRGPEAVQFARRRQAQCMPRSESYRLWSRIVAATSRLLRKRRGREAE